MKHPVKRNRRKIKHRALWWKAVKEDSAENMAFRVIGESYAEFMGKGRAPSAKGILG